MQSSSYIDYVVEEWIDWWWNIVGTLAVLFMVSDVVGGFTDYLNLGGIIIIGFPPGNIICAIWGAIGIWRPPGTWPRKPNSCVNEFEEINKRKWIRIFWVYDFSLAWRWYKVIIIMSTYDKQIS